MTTAMDAIMVHFDLQGSSKRAARRELMLNSGLSRVALTMEEWEEFLRVCRDTGVADELATFRRMVQLVDRHGDDGYGDKPTDMSRVVYWFQHVAPVTRDRSRSPHRGA